MIKRIHVYDLDGVLIDSSHRYRNKPDGSIDLNYWLQNRTQDKIAKDTLLPLANQYKADIENRSIYTIICTARARHALDYQYIKQHLGLPDRLYMRPWNNQQTDATLKRLQLQRLFNLRQFQKLHSRLWEDNLRNIEALRDLFTECFHIPSTITAREELE